MGFLRDIWHGSAPEVTDNFSTLQDLIIADQLQNGTSNAAALSVAAVYRARELNSAIPARLPVKAGGETLQDTQEDVTEMILSLQDCGDTYLGVAGTYGRGATFTVIRPDHVQVRWDQSQTKRIYLHRDGKSRYRTEGPVPNLVVVSVNRAASDLTGVGWLESASIRNAIAVNTWARDYFENNADPSGTYHLGPQATKDEVKRFKEQINARNGDIQKRSPLFTSGSITWTPQSFDAQSSQFVGAHDAATLDVSAISGVPAQFLSVALGGSNLTYTNASELWALYYEQTLMQYISRIEQAWSKIIGVEVLFDPETLLVASLEQRVRSAAELVRTGWEADPSLDVVGLPPIAHTGTVPVTLQSEESNV